MPTVTLEERLAARKRPLGSVIMTQTWKNLLFLNWPVEPSVVQKTLPPGLTVDTYEGNAYITIVPFFITDMRIGGLPSMPGMSDFLEVNVRTYVYDQYGIPGIWFYSLDLNSQAAARTARSYFALPYYYASIDATREMDDEYSFKTLREEDPPCSMQFKYRRGDEPIIAEKNSLEFFLLERYLLFTYKENHLHRLRVHHHPYPLFKAIVKECNSNLPNEVIAVQGEPQSAIFSAGVSVEFFNLEKV